MDQPTKPSTNQSINQSSKASSKESINQSSNPAIQQSAGNRAVNQSCNQPINPSRKQGVKQQNRTPSKGARNQASRQIITEAINQHCSDDHMIIYHCYRRFIMSDHMDHKYLYHGPAESSGILYFRKDGGRRRQRAARFVMGSPSSTLLTSYCIHR